MSGPWSKQKGSATIVTMFFMTLGGIVAAIGAMSFFAIYMQLNTVQTAADAAAAAGWQQVNYKLTDYVRDLVEGTIDSPGDVGGQDGFFDMSVKTQWDMLTPPQQEKVNEEYYCTLLEPETFQSQAEEDINNYLSEHYPTMKLHKFELTETTYAYTQYEQVGFAWVASSVPKTCPIVKSFRIQVGQQLRSPVFQDLLEGIEVKAWSRMVRQDELWGD